MKTGNGTSPTGATEDGVILLVDRHDLIRHCLKTLLGRSLVGLTVAAVASVADAAEHATTPIQAVVLRLEGNPADLPDVLRRIRDLEGAFATAPVMVLMNQRASGFTTEALSLGVRGCVGPAVSATDLAMALRLIINGALFIGPGVLLDDTPTANDRGSASAILPQPTPVTSGGAALTRREIEVLTHLREGKPNKIIAHELRISESTVKVHVSRILRKLRATNRTEAACANEDPEYLAQNTAGLLCPLPAQPAPSAHTH
ncbi:MAG: hypothetical protein VR70_15035 [Rhodospirillaceae bacterium BRH_c57]|nr:MAG: hypothetical protein VR70_15035 [Rhodospirillaceae bacterium BRH_c57]